ncbi:MAG: substrate-binding domain-containing protein [Enterocloster sp.]
METAPTAILAANDMMAMGAMKAVQSMGYRVPCRYICYGD